MQGHTAFLVTARRLAPGVTAPTRQRRSAKTIELEEALEAQPARSTGPTGGPAGDGSGVRAGHQHAVGARRTWMQLPGQSLAESSTSSRSPAGTGTRSPTACRSSPSASLT